MIVVWHGEVRSLYYVVNQRAPEPEQPAVLASFWSRREAEAFLAAVSGRFRRFRNS